MPKIDQRNYSSSNTGMEAIREKIVYFRGQKVLLDEDLAKMYGVEIKVLNQSVKRNLKRFPRDFMFQLNLAETNRLRSQIVTLKHRRRGMHRKYRPFAFTEQGVAMLSSVLHSDRAIEVNIRIMRAFVQMRQLALAHKELWKKIEEMESKYDKQFKVVFDALRELLRPQVRSKPKIGFHQ